MKSLGLPSFSVSDVIDRVGLGRRINRVVDVRLDLVAAEASYANHMRGAKAWKFPKSVNGITESVAGDIHWAYDAKLVNKLGGARSIYNVIRASSGGKCPICLSRPVAALDHYLPREVHPVLAIQPSNLVPICGHCNLTKSSDVAGGPSNQFLHPYFDDLGGFSWLGAEIVEMSYAPVRFKVVRQTEWSDTLFARVKFHFEFFGLADLYTAAAATHLGNYSQLLIEMHERNEPDEVSRLLAETAASYGNFGAEPWLAATMNAWSRSEWFCDGGWRPPDSA